MPFIGIRMSGLILSKKCRAGQKLGTPCRAETKHPKISHFTHDSSRFMTFLGHIASPMSRDATCVKPFHPSSPWVTMGEVVWALVGVFGVGGEWKMSEKWKE